MNAERYLLVLDPVGNASGMADATVIPPLPLRIGRPGIRLYAPPQMPIAKGPRCTVIGQIFGKTAMIERTDVSAAALTRDCWGNYLAIGVGPGGEAAWILRAPLGHLPVLYQRQRETMRLASDPELLLGPTRPLINLEFVAHHLAFPHLKTRATGITGIEELLGGECLQSDASGSWQMAVLWSPREWTTSRREISTMETAVGALRSAVSDAVCNLVQRHDHGLLELSGGLDSSVLASALAEADAGARAVTLVTEQAEGDERIYARTTAAATGLELDELPIGLNTAMARSGSLLTPRPGLPVVLWPADDALALHAHAIGAGVFVSGAGGDCVFCSPSSGAPAADAVLRFGWKRQAWQATGALARIHNASVWTVARKALQFTRGRARPPAWPLRRGLLAGDCIPASPPHHPWLGEPEGVLPGKRDHVRAILASLAHVDGYPRHRIAPTRFPLLSQPVVETALRIPTWLWIDQGCDRAVTRQAWRGLLPDRILDRRTKGGLDAYAIQSVELSRETLRDFLLGGRLAAFHMIDRRGVELVLSSESRRGGDGVHALLPLIDVEAWLRSWLDPVRSNPDSFS